MRKLLFILFVGILPIFGFGQDLDLVTWNGMSAPLQEYSTTSEAIASSGLVLESGTAGYSITGTHTNGGAINYNKFIQFKVKAGDNSIVELNKFKFNYLINDTYNGAKKIQVRYSTDNFNNNSIGTQLGVVSTVGGQALAEFNFPNQFKILNGETLSLRVYFYESVGNHTVIIRHYVNNQNHPQGPTLSGSVSYSVPTLLPLVKWYKGNKNATVLSQGIVSENVLGVNGILTSGQHNQFFQKIIQSSENTLNLSNYIELSVGVDINHQVLLKNLNFEIRKASADFKYEIRYSKDKNNFNSTYTQLINPTLVDNNNNYKNVSISLNGLYLGPNEKVFFRIYAYNTSNSYSELHLSISEGNKTGPSITGVFGSSDQCIETTNWENGAWSNGLPTTSKKVIIKSNFTADGTNFKESIDACELKIEPGAVVTVSADQYLSIKNNVVNNGTIIIENNGSFVQVNDNASYTGSSTSFVSKRTTQPVTRYDFTYWSSPVENFILKNVSPTTLFDKFFSWNSDSQSWTVHKSNAATLDTMSIGKGYTVRAPQSFSLTTSATHPTQFAGRPNNGVKNIKVSNNAADKWNLIGNPYPSAIKVLEFLKVNKGVVDGTLYFWTHKTPAAATNGNSSYYSYSSTDYVAVNLSGNVLNEGTVVAAPGGNSLNAAPGSDFQNIASGQSFFIKGKVSGATGNQVTFNNAMRVQTGKSNSAFFKPGITTPVDNWETTGKHRIWLNMTSSQNDFNQALVGYIEEATNDLDWGYDGEVFSSGAVTLYSLSNEKALTIQGRALPFSNQDEVSLGYKTTRTGTLKISIDHVDGLFEGQDVYIKDKEFNIVHNLKESDYSFATVPGTFDNRFVLLYVPQENLGTEIPVLDAKSVLVFNTGNQISVKSTDETISQVIIYDLQGRILFSKNNVNEQEFTTQSLSVSNQVVLVKVIGENKGELVKKIILN